MNLNATILGQAIAFVLFVLFCMKYVWPPLMAAIEKRQKEIADGLASAERAHKDLDLAKASATDQLKKAKAEAQVIIEQANKRRSQILDEAKAEAEQERTKIVAQAQAEIEAEREKLKEEIKKDMQKKGIDQVKAGNFIVRCKKIISNRFDSKRFRADHEDLYKSYQKKQEAMRFSVTGMNA